ncbi:hypothetical protein BKA61DRAFT_734949 [Leptodontidium sp. MPI-SDFR-AT-0119]|nr:hypothetical protein BKA61DRAFT_734949 [Leptodontidium sp. MPI-SDFR-AT-0119]
MSKYGNSYLSRHPTVEDQLVASPLSKDSDDKHYSIRTSNRSAPGRASHDLNNALQAAAAAKGDTETVKMLLQNGADASAKGGRYGNARYVTDL